MAAGARNSFKSTFFPITAYSVCSDKIANLSRLTLYSGFLTPLYSALNHWTYLIFQLLSTTPNYSYAAQPSFIMRDLSLLATSLLSVATLSYAHPHKRTSAEVTALKHATRSLNQCSSSLTKRGHNAAGIERRRAKAEQIRKERGLKSGEQCLIFMKASYP